MWSQRQVVDYALQRRSRLLALQSPERALRRVDDLDAHPLLIRAALHHGAPVDQPCPVCAGDHLVTVNYVFGDQLGQYSGRIRSADELADMAREHGEFKVCEVEVCSDCGWNFMIRSYLLGDGRKRRAPRHQETVEDIYG